MTNESKGFHNDYFEGYSKHAKSYEAYIMCHGTKRHLGLYHRAIDAAIARDRAALQLFGEYARLNLPERGGGVCG